jgi:hypothetical protein
VPLNTFLVRALLVALLVTLFAGCGTDSDGDVTPTQDPGAVGAPEPLTSPVADEAARLEATAREFFDALATVDYETQLALSDSRIPTSGDRERCDEFAKTAATPAVQRQQNNFYCVPIEIEGITVTNLATACRGPSSGERARGNGGLCAFRLDYAYRRANSADALRSENICIVAAFISGDPVILATSTSTQSSGTFCGPGLFQ